MILTFILLIVILTILFLIEKLPMNELFVLWNIYVIRRDNGKKTDPVFAKGFMRGISPPWYTGKGVQIRIGTQVLQLGFCKKGNKQEEDEGILNAMGGRYLDVTADDIREW